MNSLSPKRIHVFLLIAHGRVWLLMHQQAPCCGEVEPWPVIQTMAECEWRVNQLWLEADWTLVSVLWSAERDCQRSSQMFCIGNFNFRTSNKIMRNPVCRMAIFFFFFLIYLHVKFFLVQSILLYELSSVSREPIVPVMKSRLGQRQVHLNSRHLLVLYGSLFIISNSMTRLIISQTKSWRAPYLKPN